MTPSPPEARQRYEDTYCADLKRERDAREAEIVELRVELRELQDALAGMAQLVGAIGQWFIDENPPVSKSLEDDIAALEIRITAALAASSEEPG